MRAVGGEAGAGESGADLFGVSIVESGEFYIFDSELGDLGEGAVEVFREHGAEDV